MNILREMRKFKTKSAIAKIRMIVLLGVMLLGSAYAWFGMQVDPSVSNIRGAVVEWDIDYTFDDFVIQEQEFTIAIDEFYPGMDDFEESIVVRNKSNMTPTTLTYELLSVRLWGQEVLPQLTENGNIIEAGKGKDLFVTEDYPFSAMYRYDKLFISGKYEDESSVDSYATLTFGAKWSYEREGILKTKEENDLLDTEFGMKAYKYYKESELSEQYKPLEITIKITGSRYGYDDEEFDVI